MSNLLVKARKGHGHVANVTPENAGWTYVGFELYRLSPGESAEAATGGRETCLVFVTGKGRVSVDGDDFGVLGERMSPFDGKPWSVYLPQGSRWKVMAQTELELAVCSAPGLGGGLPARVIAPDTLGQETRGKGTNTRHVTNILPEGEPADSLLVVEVITPGGHTSSYPPHKHDRDDLPNESLSRGDLLSPARPAAGFRLPTRLHRCGSRAACARSTRRWRSRMATSCWCPEATTHARPAMATISII
jgi:5-deoxy-glucuronate isomerase